MVAMIGWGSTEMFRIRKMWQHGKELCVAAWRNIARKNNGMLMVQTCTLARRTFARALAVFIVLFLFSVYSWIVLLLILHCLTVDCLFFSLPFHRCGS